jgi:hypothetical protein
MSVDGVAAATGYLQIFDSAVAPSAGDVPMKSLAIGAAGELPSFFETIAPVTLNKGLFLAVSSTEATYTAQATNYDVWGEIEEFETQLNGTTVAGDLVTGATRLQVWANANGPKRLVRVDVFTDSSAVTYLTIFAKDSASVADGERPLLTIPLKVTSATQTFKFGNDGLFVHSSEANNTQRIGCTLVMSTTANVLTEDSGSSTVVRAFYK